MNANELYVYAGLMRFTKEQCLRQLGPDGSEEPLESFLILHALQFVTAFHSG